MNKIIQNIKILILGAIIFLFPLFFLDLTQEFFITNKLYLLLLGALLLLIITAVEIVITKKISWSEKPFDIPVILFTLSLTLSVIFSSPNKIQSILNPNFGLLIFLSLGILYFYFSKNADYSEKFKKILPISSLILSLLTIFFCFEPFRTISIPADLLFLKNPLFTPLGSQFYLAIFLGFFLILNLFNIKKNFVLNTVFSVFNLVALLLTAYNIFTNSLVLSPFPNSWFAALEIMKNIRTAFLGVGLDNFSTVFTKVKSLDYNQSPLWQIASFNTARNLPLQLLIESGIIGLSTFIFLVFSVFKQLVKTTNRLLVWLFSYLIIILLILPPSLPILFVFFLTLNLISMESKTDLKQVDFDGFPILYLGFSLIIFAFVGISGYFLSRTYLSEYYFKKSLNNFSQNNIKKVYDNMKKARILNPYEERFILNFSQTNMLIANNLIQKEGDKITEQDRLIITQAVKAAISEAKLLIVRNPNKSSYYENLANIYKNIIPLAAGADAWTVSAYQRAIILDPINPSYRIALGGVYYSLKQYNDATKLFEQAVSLKPDWANANYNLAWGYYQNGEFDKATNAMQNVVNLINKKTSLKDWEKANKELVNFKNKLTEKNKSAFDKTNLNLPKEPETKLDPKLELPPEASPEAK